MKYDGKTDPKSIPAKNCIFTNTGHASFSGGKDKGKVSLQLYDGEVHSHWYWGNIAFDLNSMKLAKSKVPILWAHDTEKRLGFADQASFEGAFELIGEMFEHSELAQDIKRDAAAGFEFESSLRFNPSKAKITYIRDGETTEVNGHTLEGPGAVVEDAVIQEGSVVVFGALNNTKSHIFNAQKFSADGGIDAFEKSHPEVYSKIFAAGEAAERDLFARTVELCDGDSDLVIKCFQEGLGDVEILEAKIQKMKADISKDKFENADPAEAEFSDIDLEEYSDNQEQISDEDRNISARAAASMKAAEKAGRIKIQGSSQNKNNGRFTKELI